MPRPAKEPPIICQYFPWRLFRRDGVYYADGRGGQHNLGKHSLGTRDRDEALNQLRRLDAKKAVELGKADRNVLQTAASVSIADGWQLYLDHCGRGQMLGGVAPKTLIRYGVARDKHVQFCNKHGVAAWNEFSKHWLEKYAQWLDRKLAARTISVELTIVKAVVHWLIDEKKLPADAKLDYPVHRPQGTDRYCFRPEEVAAMIQHCQSQPDLAWLGRIILTLAHTGLRIGELLGLRWSDVDLQARTLRVADERWSRHRKATGTARLTKGGRSRTIPIHPALQQVLAELPQDGGGYVFRDQQGQPLEYYDVRYVFNSRVREPLSKSFPTPSGETGFADGCLHSFRHYFCSQAFLGGASEGEIRQWLGHCNSQMVEHYRHLSNEDARRKMEQLEFWRPAATATLPQQDVA